MGIEFVRREELARFHSPLEGMALVERTIERRRDPLLGHWAIGSPGLAGKRSVFFGPTDEALLERLAAASRPGCFFCPERVEQATPRYPDAWVAGGCLRRGGCFLFPNLFPIGAVHAVVVLGEEHHRRLDQLDAGLWTDGFELAFDFIRRTRRHRPELGWFSPAANYLHPAGASVLHPHLQVLGGGRPATAVERLAEACRGFERRSGGDYFAALLAEEEARSERWIGRLGPTAWLTPFAPRGALEVWGVVPGRRRLCDLDRPELAGLAEGLARSLAGYRRLGFSTFNFALLGEEFDRPAPAFPVHLRLIARQNAYPDYRTDDYFVQKLLGEELMVVTPEETAATLRQGWPAA